MMARSWASIASTACCTGVAGARLPGLALAAAVALVSAAGRCDARPGDWFEGGQMAGPARNQARASTNPKAHCDMQQHVRARTLDQGIAPPVQPRPTPQQARSPVPRGLVRRACRTPTAPKQRPPPAGLPAAAAVLGRRSASSCLSVDSIARATTGSAMPWIPPAATVAGGGGSTIIYLWRRRGRLPHRPVCGGGTDWGPGRCSRHILAGSPKLCPLTLPLAP